MSYEWLLDLERAVERGKDVFACQGIRGAHWVVGKPLEELKRLAARVAEHTKSSVVIYRLAAKENAAERSTFLVPTHVGEVDGPGGPDVKWSGVEGRQGAELMRDIRHGPAPYFALDQVEMIPAL
jgi:hypothetical protein